MTTSTTRVIRNLVQEGQPTSIAVALGKAVVNDAGPVQLHEPTSGQNYMFMDDEVTRILVKYKVNRLEDVPTGIALRKTGNRDELHLADAKEAGKKYLARMGRVRPGRRDTGEMVLEHGHVKQNILASLRGAGFKMVDLHYYEYINKNPKAKRTWIIQLVMVRDAREFETMATITEAEADCLRALFDKAWGVHIWDNRWMDNPTTINFTGGQTAGKNVKKLRIKEGVMQVCEE